MDQNLLNLEKIVVESTPAEDEYLIIQRAMSDPAAFQPLYETYFRRIYLFVLHRVGDKAQTADITQQVFFKALGKIGNYQFRGLPFSSWLFRVAINECNEFFRKTKKTRFVTIDESHVAHLYEELITGTTEDDLSRKLPDILGRLAPEELTLIELRFFENKSFREIGELMNLTEINSKIRTYRILQKMKKLFLA